jgi:FtsH-binding integral membrane protein
VNIFLWIRRGDVVCSRTFSWLMCGTLWSTAGLYWLKTHWATEGLGPLSSAASHPLIVSTFSKTYFAGFKVMIQCNGSKELETTMTIWTL